uniref:Protein CURVATURE THYLAKOID 1Dic isoform X1 n=1 Tax=Rhizophora mucronata TaxID=61149 RepID=A0A2P2M283_RHIMU
MELCTCTTTTTTSVAATQAISKFPKILSPSNAARLHSKPSLILSNTAQRRRGLYSRFLSLSYSAPKAASSEDATFGGVNYAAGASEERDSAVAVEDSPPPAEKNVYIESEATQVPEEESTANEQLNEFLTNLNIKFDSQDTYSILLFGAGALVALWIASAVVSAIDSIPLFPKLMEVIGFGYTFWFTTRYFLFKNNRQELAVKFEELKQQILGSSDD